MRYFEMSSLQH